MSDVISRRDAVEVVRKWFDVIGLNPDICIDGIISLPDVAPGECADWISKVVSTDGDYAGWTCSNCGKFYANSKACFYKYCPNCGAKMDA